MRGSSPISRFRYHRGHAVAGLLVTVSCLTLASAAGWLAFLALLPLVFTVWVWRAGTDADRHGLRVRALLAERRIGWSEVSTLYPDRRRRLVAALAGGGRVPLTAVTASDADRLVTASGQPLAGGTAQ